MSLVGVPTAIPILRKISYKVIFIGCGKFNGSMCSYLVFLTCTIASLSFVCFANSLATVESLFWNTRKALAGTLSLGIQRLSCCGRPCKICCSKTSSSDDNCVGRPLGLGCGGEVFLLS